MLKPQQPASGGRKTANGITGASNMPSPTSGFNSSCRAPAGRIRSSVKPSFHSSPVFEGVYNNARMLHFFTTVVGSTCDVRVKNGCVFQGIFKTLSSMCELALDAVHKLGEGPPVAPLRREDITDTMIFSPADVISMTCRDVDLSYASRDTFTDTAISGGRMNGEHKEKVLQRWDGGEPNGDGYELENDTANGWDANEMFRYNEVKYGVTSTYDSSLSMYTMALERGSSEGYRQREARAARLASEIESNPQYRQRVSLENEEGKSDEDKYSAVLLEGERERGRDSPGASREGRYVPLPQRQRELTRERSERGGGRPGAGYRSSPPSSSSPRPSLPTATPQPAERGSPLSGRGGGFSLASPPAGAPAGAPAGPPAAEASRPHNGVASRSSPKAQRPPQSSRTRTPNTHSQSTAARSPKSSPQDTPFFETSSVSMHVAKTSGPAPLFPVDVNEILSTRERSAESPSSVVESRTSKVPPVHQRLHIEELRKFGKEFRLQPSGGSCSSPATAGSPVPSEAALSKPPPEPPASDPGPPSPAPQLPLGPAQDPSSPHRQSPAAPPTPGTPGGDESRAETEGPEGVTNHVKTSTLNPNAKEFNPIKAQMPMVKPNTAPTPPRPTPPSPVVLQHPGGQGQLYNAPYLSYVSVQPHQVYQYTMSTLNQGKYPRAKGTVVNARSDHGSSGPPMLQAASAAGAPLVASPYPQSYLAYNPQYSQQQVLQTMSYPAQPMYSMLQGGGRMMGQAGGPHPQALGPPSGPQFSSQGEGPQGPQQGLYAPQSFSHHTGGLPQPSTTPTGSQPPPQHPASSPGQNGPSGPQPQSMYHSGPLSAPTPPSMPPGHSSPQGSYPLQGYSLHGHQPMPHSYNLGQLAQAHAQGPMSGPHPSGGHGHHQVVMLQAAPPQQGPGSVPPHPPQQGAHQHFYIGHPQAMQVQTHSPFHPAGN